MSELKWTPCLIAGHCPGGETQCAPHRQGSLCALCEEGYETATAGSSCDRCPTRTASAVVSVLLMIVVVGGLVGIYAVVLRSGRDQMRLFKATFFKAETGSDSDDFDVDNSLNIDATRDSVTSQQGGQVTSTGESVAGLSNTGLETVAKTKGSRRKGILDLAANTDLNKLQQHVDLLNANSRRAPNFTYKLKIFVSFIQIMLSSTFRGTTSWPSMYRTFMSYLIFFNFDFMPWQAMSCAVGIDYLQKAVIVAMIPIVAVLGFLLCFALPLTLINNRDFADENDGRFRRKATQMKVVRLILFTIFLLYPHVSSVVIGVYNCIEIDGTMYLIGNVALRCWGEEHMAYALPFIAALVVYPVGVPVGYLIILWLNKSTMHTLETRLRLGFLYEAFNLQNWYFETVDMAFKLFMTSIIIFLPNRYELVVAFASIGVYLMIILLRQPWYRKGDDRLHLFSVMEMLIIAALGQTIQNTPEYPEEVDIALSVLLILMTIVVGIVTLTMSVRNLHKVIINKKRRTRLLAYWKSSKTTNEMDEWEQEEPAEEIMLTGVEEKVTPPQ